MTYRKRIGYAKLGRSMTFDPRKYRPAGDPEAPQLLTRLALRNPDVEFVIIGKHNGIAEAGFPPNVTDPWPVGMPRASWGQKGSQYECSFCHTNVDVRTTSFTCCEKAIQLSEAEAYVQELASNLDGMIVHCGQHGTTNQPVPQSTSRWSEGIVSHPQVWSMNYGGYLVRALNMLGDRTEGRAPVSWICTDPRNYIKARDIKWPSGMDDILSQYSFTRQQRHERYMDPRLPEELGFKATTLRGGELWLVDHVYRLASLELMILPDDWATWGPKDFWDRAPYGIATSSGYVPKDEWRRSWVTREWFIKPFPSVEVYGPWDKRSLEDVEGFEVKKNTVEEFPDLLGSWRVTLALPATSRGVDGVKWTTAKPYQCFAARVACFMMTTLDTQGWILPSRRRTENAKEIAPGLWSHRTDWTDEEIHLATWLRVETPEEFASRAYAVASSEETWTWIVNAQRRCLERRWNQWYLERTIEWQQGIGAS